MELTLRNHLINLTQDPLLEWGILMTGFMATRYSLCVCMHRRQWEPHQQSHRKHQGTLASRSGWEISYIGPVGTFCFHGGEYN